MMRLEGLLMLVVIVLALCWLNLRLWLIVRRLERGRGSKDV